MKILSINVSKPKIVEHQGKPVETGIFKRPIKGTVSVRGHQIDGDGQADLKHHGGENKAVYAYPHEHYAYWQQRLGLDALPYGQFGENLTVSGLDETTTCLGDHWRVGSAILAATQPRVPCFKLGIAFDNAAMVKLFMDEAKVGVYFKVIEAGEMTAGDAVEVIKRGKHEIAIKSLFEAFFHPKVDGAMALLEHALDVEELSAEWRFPILKMLNEA